MKFILNVSFTLIIVLLITYSLVAQGATKSVQDVCTQRISDFPAVRGLKLNMTQPDVLKVYPLASSNRPRSEIGVLTMFLVRDQIANDDLRRNLKGLAIELLDDNVKMMSFMYDDSVRWSALPKFVESLAENFNIPVNYWKVDTSSTYATVSCSDFDLIAMLIGSESSLLLQAKDYQKVIKQREKDAEERKNKSFKP